MIPTSTGIRASVPCGWGGYRGLQRRGKRGRVVAGGRCLHCDVACGLGRQCGSGISYCSIRPDEVPRKALGREVALEEWLCAQLAVRATRAMLGVRAGRLAALESAVAVVGRAGAFGGRLHAGHPGDRGPEVRELSILRTRFAMVHLVTAGRIWILRLWDMWGIGKGRAGAGTLKSGARPDRQIIGRSLLPLRRGVISPLPDRMAFWTGHLFRRRACALGLGLPSGRKQTNGRRVWLQLTKVASVAARRSASVTPSASSTIFSPPGTTSRTPRLVMMRLTTP